MSRGQERIGSVIRGKYRINALIGEGGMAVVYAATHRNAKRFALKMLHPEISVREDMRQRFVREGYVANSVQHSGAVAVVDDDVAEDGSAFIVMELLEGRSVESLQEQLGGKLPLEAALVIAHQLLDVLASAHPRGIVHRDLKPANLFVQNDGSVKVLDFGIARMRDEQSVAATKTGALMGTPAFLPPEQAAGRTREIDAQTDIWAVGATLFTMLTGEYVYAAENPAQMVVFAATQPARSVASVMPGLPPPVVELVDRATAFVKQSRWESAAVMRNAIASTLASWGRTPTTEALRAIVGRSPAAVSVAQPSAPVLPNEVLSTAQPVSSPSNSMKRRAPWMVAGAVGGVAVAMLSVVAWRLSSARMVSATVEDATAVTAPPSAMEGGDPQPVATQGARANAGLSASVVRVVPAATSLHHVALPETALPATATSKRTPTPHCHVVAQYGVDGEEHFKDVCE